MTWSRTSQPCTARKFLVGFFGTHKEIHKKYRKWYRRHRRFLAGQISRRKNLVGFLKTAQKFGGNSQWRNLSTEIFSRRNPPPGSWNRGQASKTRGNDAHLFFTAGNFIFIGSQCGGNLHHWSLTLEVKGLIEFQQKGVPTELLVGFCQLWEKFCTGKFCPP